MPQKYKKKTNHSLALGKIALLQLLSLELFRNKVFKQ